MTPLDLERVSSLLDSVRLRGPLIYHSTTGSTNDDLRDLAETGAAEGTVIIAGEQTAGRGRRERPWFGHPDHSLQFSIVLRPPLPADHFPRLVNTIGVAVAEGCAAAAGCTVGTKWPNDLILDGRKVGGVLLEANAPRYAVVGIGLNVLGGVEDFPAQLQETATSLSAAAGPGLAREGVLASVLNGVDLWYAALLEGRWEGILARQRELETTLGGEREVACAGGVLAGRVVDLSAEGGLVLQTCAGPRTVTVGEVL